MKQQRGGREVEVCKAGSRGATTSRGQSPEWKLWVGCREAVLGLHTCMKAPRIFRASW